MSQDPQNLPKESDPKKNTNWNWFLILTIIGTIIAAGGVVATLVTVPEFRCFLLHLSCAPAFQDVELFTRTEAGELLGGVEITVIGSGGAPETTQTDDHGYAKVTIANKGDVLVNLSKSGYPVQNFTINLRNEQARIRTIRLSPSGQPQVEASLTPPSSPPSKVTPATPSDAVVTALENQFMKMELSGISKTQDGYIRLAFVVTNKTSDNLYLGLNDGSGGTITDNFGIICSGRRLEGLASVGSSANKPDDFTLISPNSTLTVGQSQCNFPTSTKFNATFPLVRYQASTTNPAGEQTKFSVGFTGLKLPSQ